MLVTHDTKEKNNKVEFYKCETCGAINKSINGYIYKKKELENKLGCNCVGSKFIELKPEEIQ